MSKPYTTQTITGYNSSAPPDDGSQTANNEVTWAKHKTKLGDPVKTLAEDMNTELLSAFGLIFGQNISSHASNYTVVLADQGKFLDVTGTTTITLLPAATAGASFALAIINNGSGVVTVDGNAAETINGSATITLNPGESLITTCNGIAWAGVTTEKITPTSNFIDSGTKMLFQQTAAPTGWTKDTTHNDKALRLVSGTASSGGTDAYSTVFARTATDSHSLSVSEMPSHNHGGGIHSHEISVYTSGAGAGGRIDANQLNAGSSSITSSNSVTVITLEGGGLGHTHPLTNFNLQYVDIISATKD